MLLLYVDSVVVIVDSLSHLMTVWYVRTGVQFTWLSGQHRKIAGW